MGRSRTLIIKNAISSGMSPAKKADALAALGAASRDRSRSVYGNAVLDLPSTGATQTRSQRMRINIPCDCSGLRIGFMAAHKRSGAFQATSGPLTIKVGVVLNGTRIGVFTLAGNKVMTCLAGGCMRPDDFWWNFKAGDLVHLDIYCDAGVGNLVPYVRQFYGTNAFDTEAGANDVDYSESGTYAAGGFLSGFAPAFVTLLAPAVQAKKALVIGDSINAGTGFVRNIGLGETSQTLMGGARLLAAAGIDSIVLASGGDTAANYLATLGMRAPVYFDADICYCNYGSNDIEGAVTVDGLKALMLAIWRTHAAMGQEVWQATIRPRTSSTNNYIDSAGQSILNPTSDAKRIAMNAWYRDEGPTGAKAQSNGALKKIVDVDLMFHADNKWPAGTLIGTYNVSSATAGTLVSAQCATAFPTAYTMDNDYVAKIISGTGAGQFANLGAYTPAGTWTRSSGNWATIPDSTSVFELWRTSTGDGVHARRNQQIAEAQTPALIAALTA